MGNKPDNKKTITQPIKEEEDNLRSKLFDDIKDSIERFARTKACKDSGLECVILCDGKRIELGNKRIWSTKKYAERAIQSKLVRGGAWWLNTNNDYILTYMPPAVAQTHIDKFVKGIRREWVEKHLIVMPLREYMAFEHKRVSKNEQKRISTKV